MMRRRLARLAGAFAGLALAAALARADEPRLTVSPTVGWAGVQVLDGWTPVAVEAANAGGDFAGDLRVRVSTPWGESEVYALSVQVPGGARKRFDLEVPGRAGPIPQVTVDLCDAAGREWGKAEAVVDPALAPRLWAVLGPSWLGLEPAAHGRPGAVRVVRVPVSDAPRRALGWSSLDAAIVGPLDPAQPWAAEAHAALASWVRAGGRLVVGWKALADGFVPGVDGRAGEWRARAIPAADFAALAGAPAPRDVPAFACDTLPGAALLGPGLWSMPYGLGEVIVAGFAPDQDPLRDWAGTARLWARVLERDLGLDAPADAAAAVGTRAETSFLAPGHFSAQPARVGAARRTLLFLLAAWGTLAVFGILRWIGQAQAPARRGFPVVWVGWAIATALALSAGWLTRPDPPPACAVHWLRGVAGEPVRGTSIVSLPFPAGGSLALSLADPDGVVAPVGLGRRVWHDPLRRFAREAVPVRFEPAGPALSDRSCARGEHAVWLADWQARVPWVDAVQCRADGGRLTVRNGSPASLPAVHVWTGGRWLSRPLEAGEEAVFDPAAGTSPPEDAAAGTALGVWLRTRALAAMLAEPLVGEVAPNSALWSLAAPADTLRRVPSGAHLVVFRVDLDPGVLRAVGVEGAVPSRAWVELVVER